MISSAVVVPSNDSDGQTSSLKRKVSLPIQDDRKRPRVDYPETLNYDEGRQSPEVPRRTSVVRPTLNAAEEKKRNQRLFGGILGVVSQKGASANAAHRRRDEIEARARERAKKDAEELSVQRQKRMYDLMRKRKAKQLEWDKKAQSIRHANIRATACYLKTKTEPVLYFKPWDLRPEDEETITKQKSEVEELIQAELQRSEMPNQPNASIAAAQASQDEDSERADSAQSEVNGSKEHPPRQLSEGGTAETVEDQAVEVNDQNHDSHMNDGDDDDDQADGELVKGLEEDDVIY